MARIWPLHMNHKVKIYFFIKFITFVLITWKYVYYNYEYTFSKYLEIRSKHNISFDVHTHRLLARYSGVENEMHDNGTNYNIENERKKFNTFERLKQDSSNNVEVYLNSIKHSYSKKGVLKKFDCYCEKNIFSSLDKLEKVAKKNNVSQKRIKRILYKKYFLPFFLLSLLPLIALAMPKLVKKVKYKKYISATIKIQGETGSKSGKTMLKIWIPSIDLSLQYICVFISFIIVMSIIIYTYIKILKYRRIKAGMLK